MQVDEFTTPDMLDEEVSNTMEMNGGNQDKQVPWILIILLHFQD